MAMKKEKNKGQTSKKPKEKEIKESLESELEKEIKETESQETSEVLEKISEETIDDNEFREFIQPSTQEFINMLSPVLEKVEIPQQESLEQDVSSISTSTEKEDETPTKYDTGYIEPNYENIKRESIKDENLLIKRPVPVNIEMVGRDLRPQIEQNFQINPEIQELRKSQGKLEEDYIAKAEKLDTGDNRLPFESTQRKYKGRII